MTNKYDKLIELLNEFEWYKEDEFESWKLDENWYLTEWWDYFRIWTEMKVVSKAFWFIKRLVDNDKIDFVKLYDEVSDYCEELVPYPWYDCALMMLSIQDNPIEFLISLLKD